jgi:Mn-dependent DtxR family transcriptional regulator
MPDTSDILRLRILICFLQSENSGCTVTGLSKTLGVEKYTISRMLSLLEREGLIDKNDTRHPCLTEEGRAEAERYSERINTAISHLMYEGVDMENAKNDAFNLALYCSEQTMTAIRITKERYRLKDELSKSKCFGGTLLAKMLCDGEYKFPFIMYRENFKNGDNMSPMNNCFNHPCVLNIQNNSGNVQLCIVRNSVSAYKRIKNIKYYYDGIYYNAEMYGDILQIPIEVLKFENLGVGIGQGQIVKQVQHPKRPQKEKAN